jgi:hypothetical protein
VKRNIERFPQDFLLRLSDTEVRRFDIAICDIKTGARRPPQTALGLHRAWCNPGRQCSQLSARLAMGVYVVRACVRLREFLVSNTALARKLDELERKYQHHDEAITAILSAIRELTNLPAGKRRGIGFTADLAEKP